MYSKECIARKAGTCKRGRKKVRPCFIRMDGITFTRDRRTYNG